jgi:hypothetical protein
LIFFTKKYSVYDIGQLVYNYRKKQDKNGQMSINYLILPHQSIRKQLMLLLIEMEFRINLFNKMDPILFYWKGVRN